MSESFELYQFVEEIDTNYSNVVEMEFVGGQYRAIILHCTISVFASDPFRKYVDSFFELPLLARIEKDVFEKAVFFYFNPSKTHNETVQLTVFSSTNDIRKNLDAYIPLSFQFQSKVVVNETHSSRMVFFVFDM